MQKSIGPINVMIKPASSSCNLACKYCFYHDLADKRSVKSHGIMQDDVLETIVKRTLSEAELFVTIGFQGGEPTLAGLDFFKKLIQFETIYNVKKLPIQHFMQTNGLKLDEEWARFLHDNKFLVGISLDGPKDIHDHNRVTTGNKGSHQEVLRKIKLLQKHQVDFNLLTVVTNESARKIQSIYRYLKGLGVSFLQFIPCLDPLDDEPGQERYSLTIERYQSYLISLFDLWLNDLLNGEYVSIRQFDNLYQMVNRNEPELCTMKGHCSLQNIIESNGDVYPCDFYVIDKYKMGNLKDSSFLDLYNSEPAQTFLNESIGIHEKCKSCKWLSFCRGGCRRNQDIHGEITLNYYCDALYAFHEHAVPKLVQALPKIQQIIKNTNH